MVSGQAITACDKPQEENHHDSSNIRCATTIIHVVAVS
jgi:hypothetical protein